jgi:hypothetical protein
LFQGLRNDGNENADVEVMRFGGDFLMEVSIVGKREDRKVLEYEGRVKQC